MNTGSVSRTNLKVDDLRLQKAFNSILTRYPLNENIRQICLTSHKTEGQSVNDGIGCTFNRESLEWTLQEKDFLYFINEFRGTYFEELYKELQIFSGYNIARMRIMYLPARTCYSFHFDNTKRYHIGISTNQGAFLVFAGEPPVHIPRDGYVYEVDTRNYHTAINCGDSPRVHLVVSLKNDKNDDRLFNDKIKALQAKYNSQEN